MSTAVAPRSTYCCPSFPKGCVDTFFSNNGILPKAITILIPVIGPILGLFMESSVRAEYEATSKGDLAGRNKLIALKNQYKICHIIHAVLLSAAIITEIALIAFNPIVGAVLLGMLTLAIVFHAVYLAHNIEIIKSDSAVNKYTVLL